MADIDISEFKYSYLKDPETCPILELEKQVADLTQKTNFFETKQLAIKKFINSVYGALGSKYFVAHNTAIAESITAQGRDLNHYSENSVNAYFKGLFQSNPKITLYYQWVHRTPEKKYTFATEDKPDDYYVTGKWEECMSYAPAVKKGKKLTPELKHCLQDNSKDHCDWFMTSVDLFTKLGMSDEQKERAKNFDISKGATRDMGELTGPEFSYLEGTRSLAVGGDTDSISNLSNIDVKMMNFSSKSEEKFENINIEKLYKMMKIMNNDSVIITPNGSEVVPNCSDMEIQTYDVQNDSVTFRPINYIMRHKVKKARYRITSESGKTIDVTGDHSCMVVREGELISIKAKDINPETDKIMTIDYAEV